MFIDTFIQTSIGEDEVSSLRQISVASPPGRGLTLDSMLAGDDIESIYSNVAVPTRHAPRRIFVLSVLVYKSNSLSTVCSFHDV